MKIKILIYLVASTVLYAGTSSASESSADICVSKPYKARLEQTLNVDKELNAVSWSSDGQRIITSSAFGTVATVWTDMGIKIFQIDEGPNEIFPLDSISIQSEYNYLIMPAARQTDSSNALSIWDIESGNKILDVKGPQPDMGPAFNLPWHYTLSPDGQSIVITALRGEHVALYDTKDWHIKWNIELPKTVAASLAFSSTSDVVGVGTIDGRVLLLSSADAHILSEYRVYHDVSDASVNNLRFSPDGKFFAAGAGLSMDGRTEAASMKIIKIEDGSEYRTFSGNRQPIRGIGWLLNGCAIAVADDTGVSLYPTDNDNAVPMKFVYTKQVISISSVPSSNRLAVAAGREIKVFLISQ